MRVAIYGRVSTASDDQANALEQQLARLERAASARGDNDPARYIDIASGSRDDRPELTRLLADCAAGLIGEVVITRLDRLSRSSSHGAQLLTYFAQERSPNLVALDDSLDLSTPGGRFMARLLVSWAEAETDRLAERTRHGHNHRRAQRKAFGWKAPYGYSLEAGQLVANPAEFGVAQAGITRFMATPRLGALRSWFFEQHGHNWGSNFALRRWLLNPTLAGARAYGQRRVELQPDGTRRKLPRRPGDYAEIHWSDDSGQPFQPPLLTREQHAWLLAHFEATATPAGRPAIAGQVRPLTGLIRCRDCSRSLGHHHPGKGGPTTLRCTTMGCPSRWKNLREQEVRLALLAALQGRASALLLHIDELAQARAGELSPEAQALRDQIQQLEGMADPELQPVIAAKKEKLARLVAATSQDNAGSFLRQMATFQSPELGAASEADPTNTRRILQRFISAEASAGELVVLRFASSVCGAGQPAVLDVSGLGLGRPVG